MPSNNTSLDLGGEFAAREEWLSLDHPDRIAWERKRKQNQEQKYIDKSRAFHEAYGRLAPKFGYETGEDTKEFDPTSRNGQLLIAVMKELF